MPLERVKQFKDLMVDYETAGADAKVEVYTDMPGSTLASRKSYTLPATTGRQTRNVPLDGIEGTLIKFKFVPPTAEVMRVYAATLRLRAVGVYLDGTNGEIWETLPMGFGI